MAFVGQVPSEASSGESRRQGGLTKTGNAHVRRLLIEAAWHYVGLASTTASPALARRREGVPQQIIDIADRASSAAAEESLCPDPAKEVRHQNRRGLGPRAGRVRLGSRLRHPLPGPAPDRSPAPLGRASRRRGLRDAQPDRIFAAVLRRERRGGGEMSWVSPPPPPPGPFTARRTAMPP